MHLKLKTGRLPEEEQLRLLAEFSGATVIRKPKRLFSWFREGAFCEFEPYGDNSRYWVGKKEEGGW